MLQLGCISHNLAGGPEVGQALGSSLREQGKTRFEHGYVYGLARFQAKLRYYV